MAWERAGPPLFLPSGVSDSQHWRYRSERAPRKEAHLECQFSPTNGENDMKKSRFKTEQIIGIVKEADSGPTSALDRAA